MNDLRNTLMEENLKTKVNVGLIPRIDPLTQFVIQPVSVNSFFAIGRYQVNGHLLTYQLHIMLMRDIVNYNVTVTDETTGEYFVDDKVFPQAICTIQTEGEGKDAKQIIRLPNGCLEGSSTEMHWEGLLPQGKVVVDMVAYGYPVFNGGSGQFGSCLKDEVFSQYSLPTMKSKGVIELDGKTYPFEGNSWVDRQWQQESEYHDISQAKWTWTWMDINLDNGDIISLWDMHNITRNYNYAWGTLMHPDGTQSVAQMGLLKENTSEFWHSPVSGNNYPTRFHIVMKDIATDLDVRVKVKESEIVSQVPFLTKYEGACSVEGTYLGKPASGHCLVEMLGIWSAE